MFKEELAEIGLIYRRKSNSRRFYATSSALQLATYKGGGGAGAGDGGFHSSDEPAKAAGGGSLVRSIALTRTVQPPPLPFPSSPSLLARSVWSFDWWIAVE
jgi:hypothetical protein